MSRDAKDNLGPETDKRALLAELLKKRAAQNAAQNAARNAALNAKAPLSFAQQRLWLLDQLNPGSGSYNISRALRFKGPLDVQALEASLNAILARHSSLRTNFRVVEGEPQQVISPERLIKLVSLDLSSLPADNRESDARKLASDAVLHGFDLEQSDLFRAMLFRLAEQDHVLLLIVHHIVADGWSLGILLRELGILYESFSQSRPSPLDNLPIQYVDFARRQRGQLQGDYLKELLDYWKQQLSAAPQILEFSNAKPRPAVQTFAGAYHTSALSGELSTALNRLSRNQNVTLFMTLLTAFKIFLYRYTDRDDILVGTPIANRTNLETEALIGLFVNTLVMRTNLAGEPSFSELLGKVREAALDAYAHQDLPFEKLVEEIQPERSLGHMPLFQVLFALQNAPKSDLRLGSIDVTDFSFPKSTSKLDLSLYVGETPQGLTLTFEYSTDLFDSSTIERMAANFGALLEGIVANPDARISELPLLTDSELQLLLSWNNEPGDEADSQLVHEIFENQAKRSPEATAVVFGAEQLSYGALNRRANQLANYLLGLGQTLEQPCGVLLERSIDMVVAMLAILKAGGAYLPLDPAHPEDRLQFMIRDAGVNLLISSETLRARWSNLSAEVLCLDRQWSEVNHASETTPQSGASAENLAYVIYTSGSTGEPKGVALTHRTLVHLWTSTTQQMGFSSDDIWTTVHSITFDFSVWEIWICLLHGGRLIVVPREITESPEELYQLLEQHKVTVLNQTPAALRQLLEARKEAINTRDDWSVRVLVCGGDSLDRELGDELASLSIPVWNFYGPTESTVWAAANLIDADETASPVSSIGRPLPGIKIDLLSRFLRPAPVGVAAEVFIGGNGLARGYFNRPDLTAERFLPDPFSNAPGARLYRTGDSARYCENGKLEFLGRLDQQIKLRGFRIELGEIEVAISRHPDVAEVVVVLNRNQTGDKSLVAYLVLHGGRALERAEIAAFLAQSLPDYMVPSVFVTLAALPLTANQKIDRAALANRDLAADEQVESFVAPRFPAEEIVCDIWAAVLGRERVGINDNFFALGGHSLLATQALSRIRAALKVDVPLRSLFQHPTVAGLVASFGEGRKAEAPLVSVDRSLKIPASFAQRRVWFLDQLEPDSAYNLSRALQLRGRVDIEALRFALNALVARHESLRTSFKGVDGQPIQVITSPREVELNYVDFRELEPAERTAAAQRYASAASAQAFNLTRDLLMRASVLQLEDDVHVLLIITHHIASDGWSMSVMVRELGILYTSFAHGDTPELPSLPIQYADFAAWQNDRLTGKELEQQTRYWQNHLTGAPAFLELPADRRRPAVQTSNGAHYATVLSPSLTDSLKELSRSEGVTLFMTLLGAFQTLLLRYTAHTDVVVGTPIAGRNRSELEGLIGYFANTLVMRSDLSGNPSFRELLRRIREVTLEAYAHQELPFEKLVEEIHPERSLSHNPLFQVLFALQNVPKTGLNLPELEVSEFSFDRRTTKLDLSLYVREVDGGLTNWFEYSTDLFDGATIERLASHFQTLLEGIVANPDGRLADFSLLTPAEEQQLLVGFNKTEQVFRRDQLVTDLFEREVERHPNSIAVLCENESLTYAALNRKANQLAGYLRQKGVGPDAVVGLFLERSVEMIVAMLGVMKAGGAYLPIDTSYPRERIDFTLKDSGAQFVLTSAGLRDRLAETTTTLISLDDPQITEQSDTNLRNQATPANLAYVIYTSGSTGKPKGVAVTHASVINLVQSTTPLFAFASADVWTVTHSYAFDFSVWEIFGALLTGGKLVIVPKSVTQNPAEYYRLLRAERVTVVGVTPTALRQLLPLHHEFNEQLSLRLIVCGGEALPAEMIPQVLALGVPTWNFFGPTEATVWVSLRQVEGDDAAYAFAPLGQPIGNCQLFILDAQGQPLPFGVPGELCIGGYALARGYLNRPELTADKFVPNRYAVKPGARLYRTGDLARRLPNGLIEFIGRSDHQVKLRGFRIELGEIEAVLSSHPAVQQSVIVCREDVPGQPTLIAYLVASESDEPSPADLRLFLKESLPEYMIPSDFIILSALPQNSSGKIDRLALPVPDRGRPALKNDFMAPRTTLERDLADIWSSVLRPDRIGITDNFFELGGHSLLATQLISRIRSRLGIELPVRRLFETPTILDLSRSIEATGSSIPHSSAIKKRARRGAEEIRLRINELSEEEVDSLLEKTRPGADTHP